jgi:hypothetical protein
MKRLNQKGKQEIGQRKTKILVKAKYEITHGLSELGADSVETAYEMYATPFHICSFFKRQAGLAF